MDKDKNIIKDKYEKDILETLSEDMIRIKLKKASKEVFEENKELYKALADR